MHGGGGGGGAKTYCKLEPRQSLSSNVTANMSNETMLRQRLFLTVQKALPGDFFPFLIAAFFGENKII